jgi:hypothetical protein
MPTFANARGLSALKVLYATYYGSEMDGTNQKQTPESLKEGYEADIVRKSVQTLLAVRTCSSRIHPDTSIAVEAV